MGPRRLTIGLRYKPQEAWTGGVHYVRGLVRALGLLPAAIRPRIITIGGDKQALEALRAATDYPDLTRVASTRVHAAPARRWDVFRLRKGAEEEIDVILLGSSPGLEGRAVQWIPDFQEDRLPGLFSPEERTDRHARNARWLADHRHLMLSSRDAAADLERYYPGHGARVHVVPFATFLEGDPASADQAALRARHGLPARYFLCANQVWKHKNHAVVLRALARTAPSAPPVVFTGKEEDYRHPEHPAAIRALAETLGVEDRALFLGFLPREEQLAVMAAALAVIQPSLCEGWSTVIEDAKALGRPVIASELPVHHEQLGAGADYFAAEDERALALILDRYAVNPPSARAGDYGQDQRRFARRLWAMITKVERDYRRRGVDRLVITR